MKITEIWNNKNKLKTFFFFKNQLQIIEKNCPALFYNRVLYVINIRVTKDTTDITRGLNTGQEYVVTGTWLVNTAKVPLIVLIISILNQNLNQFWGCVIFWFIVFISSFKIAASFRVDDKQSTRNVRRLLILRERQNLWRHGY